MWLNLLALLMLVLITFFQSLQGLFSAMILFVLSVISSVVAFAFYEDLYLGLFMQWMPGEGEAVSLALLFLVTLLILRLLADKGLKGNVMIPARIDRIGGATMGFFAAMVMTGTAMTAVQMLPFDRAVLGFTRYTGQMVAGRPVEKGLFLRPDGFASGLAGLILDGSLSGKASADSFAANHPDFLGEMDARRSAGPLPDGAKGNSIKVERMWWPDKLGTSTADNGMKYLTLRVTPGGPPAFTAAQMSLVVNEGSRLRRVLPRGLGDGSGAPAEVELLSAYTLPKALDLVYIVPANTAEKDLAYVMFNGWAKAEPSEEMRKDTAAPPVTGGSDAPAKAPAPDNGNASAQRNPTGRTHGANLSDAPYVSDDLPGLLNIPMNEASSLETSGKKIVSGHLVIQADTVKRNFAAVASITKFNTPGGMKLVQVPIQRVFAGSIPGQAINFADKTFQQSWTIKDANGKAYMPVGAFAQADAGGTEMIEIQYYATEENMTAGHTLGPWRRIKENDFRQPGAKLIFLYLVPPGTRIVSFETNRGGGSEIDLQVN